ncbi:MAG: translation elongation factor [Crocosphaera sp.]|nr:translation elongation factor [Crocosphaera sp.]
MTKNYQNLKENKNDQSWNELFKNYSILNKIENEGFFIIESEKIKQYREPRLMVKFDHKIQLPKVFLDNNLSILPISRYKYVIGHFNTHYSVKYDQDLSPIEVDFPDAIKSIDYTNISSESLALNCAFITEMILEMITEILTNEPSFYHQTLSGRMSTGKFYFKIKNKKNNEIYSLSVDGSQCEIDGGFETEDALFIFEVKMGIIEDFLVRQLYYPYRLWKNKIDKQVIPVLMTYSNNLFSFFVYKFSNPSNYNSIKLIKQINYRITPESIETQELTELFKNIEPYSDNNLIPFPQADIFDRVVDLLSLLNKEPLTKQEISNYYGFSIRQAGYYSNAAKYLGLVEYKEVQVIEEEESSSEVRTLKLITLTDEGLSILSYGYKQKILSLIEKILQDKVFYETFSLSLDASNVPSEEEIVKIMKNHSINENLSDKTKIRRSRSVRNWIKWIWLQVS